MPSAPSQRRLRAAPFTLLAVLALVVTVTYAFSTPSNASQNASPDDAAAQGASTRAAQAGDPPPEDFWGDVSDIPPAENELTVKILNRTNGEYEDDEVYWTFDGETHTIADQPYLDMPANSAGRMEFHVGDPESEYNDFIEFTVGDGVFNGNTTRVDAYGLPLAMRLHSENGDDQQVGEDYEIFQQSREETFQSFADEVPEEFQGLADEEQTKIISPGSDPEFQSGGAYADYFAEYADSVGVSASNSEIFGCAGDLGDDPDTCAALNRHVADLPEGDQSDPANFYQEAPANYYAQYWHEHSIDNLAYGFPYDDAAEQASFISHQDPEYLLVAVGY